MIKIPENLRFRMYPESSIQPIERNWMVNNKEIIKLCDPNAPIFEGRKAEVVKISGWGYTLTSNNVTTKTEHLISAESFFEFQKSTQFRKSTNKMESIDERFLLLNNEKVWACEGDSGGKRNKDGIYTVIHKST